jgi:Tfp pilus assembly protein PilN
VKSGVQDSLSVESLTSILTGGVSAMAVMGIFLTLILTGKLHTDGEFQREAAALDREKQGHDQTRQALAEAAARADTAVRAAQMIADAFTRSGTKSVTGSGDPP